MWKCRLQWANLHEQLCYRDSSDANGCDSITLAEIVVDQPYVLNQQFQARLFVFNGITYTASTTITETYSSPRCDSIIVTLLPLIARRT